MNLDKAIERARTLLFSPRTAWPVLAAEPATISGLYREYFLILAAVTPLCRFVKASFLGYASNGFYIYRVGFFTGLTAAVVEYAVSLLAVYVMALIVEALAPYFGGQPNRVQALKGVGYSYTASWIAGIAVILPALYLLVALAGAIYSIYLLYLGLPSTMKVLPERAVAYTAATAVAALVLGWIIGAIAGAILGVSLAVVSV